MTIPYNGIPKTYNFPHDDAKSNRTAQIVNAVGQTCLLLGILFAG